MTTPLARATRSSFAAALRVSGVLGTYTYRSTTVNATFAPSKPTAEGVRGDGETSIDVHRVDLLTPWDSFGTGDEFVEPKHGARIVLADGREFELAKDPTGAVWRWSDGSQAFLRIFAREV